MFDIRLIVLKNFPILHETMCFQISNCSGMLEEYPSSTELSDENTIRPLDIRSIVEILRFI
jgi:hypothetical protein